MLSGPMGVGKTTLQAALLRKGCWCPHLLTSRPVELLEQEHVEHLNRAELIELVRDGRAGAPAFFGDELYAWADTDVTRLHEEPGGAVVTARPYTALLVAAMVPRLIPVWLDLADDLRRARVDGRATSRDLDGELAQRRLVADAEDLAYRELFRVRVTADATAVERLEELLERHPNEPSRS